ncbi:hypothetical protein IAI10_19635 [Clostridium sp. 19966]|uniref:hypothetical protein n=1 Tax=Clostridium sp. 19966 TaxID=2768166 RepID=UPI0028DE0669|nr:hypothetical protein [Clostridium sp. 19966]MDT8718870.1 hypothetical protein [Clostridium sp. 19966]
MDNFYFDQNAFLSVSKYADNVTKDLNEYRKDVYAFKENLKLSLAVMIEEMLQEGLSIDDALKATIEECDKDKFLKNQIKDLKKKGKHPEKKYFKIALITSIIAILMLVAGCFHNFITIGSTFFSKSYPIIKDNIGTNNELITSNMENSLKKFVDNRWYVEAGALYSYDTFHINDIGTDFSYTYSSKQQNINKYYFTEKKSNFFFTYRTHHDYYTVSNSDTTVDALFRYKVFSYEYFMVAITFLLIYWISFGIGASYNMSYAGYPKGWIALVWLLNVFGYMIFQCRFTEERNKYPIII